MNEKKIVLLFCIVAGVHVFIFSAAFPFFNNVDEREHFDLTIKYSLGHVPRGEETFSPESAPCLSLYDSSAYFGVPPPWKQPVEITRMDLAAKTTAIESQKNYESAQPPLYYALAGFWWNVERRLGFEDGTLLYGLRFLNILPVVILVWLGYATARMIFPQNSLVRLGVPALIALIPQSAFYSIVNDVLSPLCFGAVFICLLKLRRAEIPSVSLGTATGLALAATFLTKMTNLPLLVVAFAIAALKILQLVKSKKLRAALPSLASLFFCPALPMAAWVAWSKNYFGDFTGSQSKAAHFGWTLKPFGEWWRHPIFSTYGVWTYLSGQLATFWQGEFWWHDRPMSRLPANVAYTMISLILLATACAQMFRHQKTANPQQHDALCLSLACVAATLGFFAFLSVIYDFHDGLNPSRALPFFRAGRMMLGALIPFLLLFLYGFDQLLKPLKSYRTRLLILSGMILLMLTSEIATDWPVFSNQYNWFHL